MADICLNIVKSHFKRKYKVGEDTIEIRNSKPMILLYFNYHCKKFRVEPDCTVKTSQINYVSYKMMKYRSKAIMRFVVKNIKNRNKDFQGNIYVVLKEEAFDLDSEKDFFYKENIQESLKIATVDLEREIGETIQVVPLSEKILTNLIKEKSRSKNDCQDVDWVIMNKGEKTVLTFKKQEFFEFLYSCRLTSIIDNLKVKQATDLSREHLSIQNYCSLTKVQENGLFISTLLKNFKGMDIESQDVNRVLYHSNFIINILKFIL